ncbi:hypothetical protein SprV_0301037700 [Sparganum proliferum]
MMANITNNRTVPEVFSVTSGMEQGCQLPPTLSSLMFSTMLVDAYRDERARIRITYRAEGNLLNSRRMQASTCLSTDAVYDLLFEDDRALSTKSEGGMQRSMGLFAAGCAIF